MGNGFSEEANAPEKAMVRPVINITHMRRKKIEGAWEEEKEIRRKIKRAEDAALRTDRNTAPTLSKRRAAASQIQKRLLENAQRRNETRRAVARHRRYGQKDIIVMNTQTIAPNAIRNSPLDKLNFYLEVPKREGYYTDRKKLFLTLSTISDLQDGCNTEIKNDNGVLMRICKIILDDKHTELARAIAAIDRRTFMDRFRSIATLYNECEEKYPSLTSQVTSTLVDISKGAAAITTNPAEPIVQSFWGWFSGLFTRRNRANTAPSQPQQSQPQQPQQSQPQSQPQSQQPSQSTRTRQPIDNTDEERAGRASELLSHLTSDDEKSRFLKIYDEAKELKQLDEREVAFDGFNRELTDYLKSKSRGASRPPSGYVPLPTLNKASRIAAASTSEEAVSVAQDTGAGVFPPSRKGGSRTRKHKRKPRPSK